MRSHADRVERTRRPPLGVAALMWCGLATFPCAVVAQAHIEAAPLPAPFSTGTLGATLPRGWEAVSITDRKRPTRYTLVDDAGVVVLHAHAVGAASSLAQFARFDIRSAPVVEWRWKVSSLIEGADNRVAGREDSPVRLMFAFDGDKALLSIVDRAFFYMSQKVSGRELPYAMLQYVWANTLPVGTVIDNPHTRRIRMLVVASGPGGVGQWQSLSRNLYDDYRRAFEEEPGLLTSIGVLTDTDNTGGSVDAWYGDIRFLPAGR